MVDPVAPTAEVKFRSDITVELVKATASDSDVAFAARVSTAGEQSLESVDADPASAAGLIRYPDAGAARQPVRALRR